MDAAPTAELVLLCDLSSHFNLRVKDAETLRRAHCVDEQLCRMTFRYLLEAAESIDSRSHCVDLRNSTHAELELGAVKLGPLTRYRSPETC